MDMQLHRDWVREVWLGLVGACGASIDLSSVPQDGTLGASGIGRRGGRRSSVSTPVPPAPAGTEQRRPIDPRAVLCSAPSRYDDSRGGLARHILLPASQLPPWSSHRLHTHTILPLRLDLKGPLSAQCCSTVDTSTPVHQPLPSIHARTFRCLSYSRLPPLSLSGPFLRMLFPPRNKQRGRPSPPGVGHHPRPRRPPRQGPRHRRPRRPAGPRPRRGALGARAGPPRIPPASVRE